jgi:predicted permease
VNWEIAGSDLRYALRTIRRAPLLSGVIVISLAIGIGANTAIFSVADSLFLKPLPYPEPDRLGLLFLRIPGLGIQRDWPSPGEFVDIQSENKWFSEMSIALGDSFNVTGSGEPMRAEGLWASSSLFHLLGAKARVGRTLLPEDDQPGKPLTAVITYGAWKRMFGADPGILGRTININGQACRVVGVLDPGFLLNGDVMPMTSAIERPDIFIPLRLTPQVVAARSYESFSVVVRLKPGVSFSQAQAGLDVISARVREQDKRDATFSIVATPMTEQAQGGLRRIMIVLVASVGFVLLIACANAANLLLSRAAAREKEAAIRSAVGSGRFRLFRQLITEALVLSLAGGVGGAALAWGLIAIARVIQPGNIPRIAEIGMNGEAFLYTSAISILTGLFFGALPAMRLSSANASIALRASGRGIRSSTGSDRLRSVLVIMEIAFSLLLLIGAGLLIQSFIRLNAVRPGFDAAHALSMSVTLRPPLYRGPKQWAALFDILPARIEGLPGVESAGATSSLPLSGTGGWSAIEVEGFPRNPDQPELQSDQRSATPDYFRTLRIPLLAGRYFTGRDTPDSPLVAIVDEQMARRFWPQGTAVGKRVRRSGRDPWIEIAGVVGVVKQYGLDLDARMTVYFPQSQFSLPNMYIVARMQGDPASAASAVVHAIHDLDPQLPVYGVRTMEERLSRSIARQRFAMSALGAFAAFALILAVVGIYGVVSYLVTQSTHDIGIRMALGALPRNILAMVIGHGMKLASVGLATGLLGAMFLTRLMETLLFGVRALDAATFAGVAILLALVALAASYIPALRAARLDPTEALRDE